MSKTTHSPTSYPTASSDSFAWTSSVVITIVISCTVLVLAMIIVYYLLTKKETYSSFDDAANRIVATESTPLNRPSRNNSFSNRSTRSLPSDEEGGMGNFASPPFVKDPVNEVNSILAKGIFLHTTKGPKQVNMSLVGVELRWYSPVTGKKFLIEMPGVKYVETGKKTHNFNKQASLDADELRCFSLVCQSTTVDLEAMNERDRDVLVENFHRIIEAQIADRRSEL